MKIRFTLSLFLFCLAASGQDLIESRRSSYYTYIYKITAEEARTVYKKSIWEVDSSFFHTLIDSVPSDSLHQLELWPGNYLSSVARGADNEVAVISIPNLMPMILDNNTDLCIQLLDSVGGIITDAKLYLNKKKLKLDNQTQAFTIKKTNKQGMLQIEHQGLVSFYDLDRRRNNPRAQRVIDKAVYGTPVRYVWVPINFAIRVPIDGVKSIYRMGTVGTIGRIRYFFESAFYKTACLFDDYYCDDYGHGDKYQGFMVLNKPKFRHGDTLKYKVYLANQKGKPLNKDLILQIGEAYNLYKNIDTLEAYQNGVYHGRVHLHDSLDLKLDRNYQLQLRGKKGKRYLFKSFYMEDYELSGIKFTAKPETTVHYKGESLKLKFEGTDENKLKLKDARIKIEIKAGSVSDFFGKEVFVPDSIWTGEIPLDPKGETAWEVPDTLFPTANLQYSLVAQLLTSDNQTRMQSFQFRYLHRLDKISLDLEKDSIHIRYLKNGQDSTLPAKIYGVDLFGNQVELMECALSTRMPVQSAYSEIFVEAGGIEGLISMEDEEALLNFEAQHLKNEVKVQSVNPRGLYFTYYLYEGNKELTRGNGYELDYQSKVSSRKACLLSVQYLWAGEMHKKNYPLEYQENQLQISVIQPQAVSPGQEVEIKALVTDAAGKPVANADLTALAHTAKLNSTNVTLPSFKPKLKRKEDINHFYIWEEEDPERKMDLDYKAWCQLARLDTIEYYQFLYPEEGLYQTDFLSSDSLTQFAPFVVKDGIIQNVHVIYVDYVPVYFSWSTNERPYSFKVSPGKHHVVLRTDNHQIEIDSLNFQYQMKKIVSVDINAKHAQVNVAERENELGYFEKDKLYDLIFPFRYDSHDMSYLNQKGFITNLEPERASSINQLAGPVFPSGFIYQKQGHFSHQLTHEPFFEYEFLRELVKMRNVKVENRYPARLDLYKSPRSFRDQVLTQHKINKNQRRKKAYDPVEFHQVVKMGKKGQSKLIIDLPKNLQDKGQIWKPNRILLFNSSDSLFLHINKKQDHVFDRLVSGIYQLVLIDALGQYASYDSIHVPARGSKYFRIDEELHLEKDTAGYFYHKSLAAYRGRYNASLGDKSYKEQLPKIENKVYVYSGNGQQVHGVVLADEDGSALPGVNVLVKGTARGTITDMDGNFSIYIPEDRATLSISYIGYLEQEIKVYPGDLVEIHLTPDICALEEVVVTALGVRRVKSMSYAMAVADGVELNKTLEGKVAGLDMVEYGNEGSVIIRGTTSLEANAQPLYIIDGKVYLGAELQLAPDEIQEIKTLKGKTAAAVYGSQAAHGLVLITTRKQAQQKEEQYDQEAIQGKSIRNNFSDEAFWQPALKTDKNGIATFKVTYPDDITSWAQHFIAVHEKQLGQAKATVKSFKPIMAQITAPRFLIRGDSANAIGKVLNYTADSIEVESVFEMNGQEAFTKSHHLLHSALDTLALDAGTRDSLELAYSIEKEDGYKDGEIRSIPVFEAGLSEAVGSFAILEGDTVLHVAMDSALGSGKLYIQNNPHDLLIQDLENLKVYKYSCNEQLATKLKAMLALESIKKESEVVAKKDPKIKKIIKNLLERQQSNYLWSWWSEGVPSYWISEHVIEALVQAENCGYHVKLDKESMASSLVLKLKSDISTDTRLKILQALHALGIEIDYQPYLSQLDTLLGHGFKSRLRFIELQQAIAGVPASDTLKKYILPSTYGNLYCSSDEEDFIVMRSDIEHSLRMYRICKSDSLVSADSLSKMRNYFFEKRKHYGWRNTYESISIIETILADYSTSSSNKSIVAYRLNGGAEVQVSRFPLALDLETGDEVTISKNGRFPVLFTAYQRQWLPNPVADSSKMKVVSYFDEPELKAGEQVKLHVEVELKDKADYVMLNIPIPAGCSYGEKKKNRWKEDHREYFRNEVAIFCTELRKGMHHFEVELVPRYTGKYILNPAKIELMYFPTIKGHTEIKQVKIL